MTKKIKAHFRNTKGNDTQQESKADETPVVKDTERAVTHPAAREPKVGGNSLTQMSLSTSSVPSEPPIRRFTNGSDGPWSSVALSESQLPIITAHSASTPNIQMGVGPNTHLSSSSPLEKDRDKIALSRSWAYSGSSPTDSSSYPRPREPDLMSPVVRKSLRSSFSTTHRSRPTSQSAHADNDPLFGALPSAAEALRDLTTNSEALYESEAVESDSDDYCDGPPSPTPENSTLGSSYEPARSSSDLMDSLYVIPREENSSSDDESASRPRQQ